MGFCQWAVIVIYLLSLGISLAKHGEVKVKRESFWSDLVSAIIMFLLLKFGGFFG